MPAKLKTKPLNWFSTSTTLIFKSIGITRMFSLLFPEIVVIFFMLSLYFMVSLPEDVADLLYQSRTIYHHVFCSQLWRFLKYQSNNYNMIYALSYHICLTIPYCTIFHNICHTKPYQPYRTIFHTISHTIYHFLSYHIPYLAIPYNNFRRVSNSIKSLC